MKFNPLSDRVVLEPVESDDVTSGGIIIPDTAKEKPQEGKVVAVGPGKVTDDGKSVIALTVSVGDRVVYSKYAGTEVKQDGKEYVIVREADVLAVLN